VSDRSVLCRARNVLALIQLNSLPSRLTSTISESTKIDPPPRLSRRLESSRSFVSESLRNAKAGIPSAVSRLLWSNNRRSDRRPSKAPSSNVRITFADRSSSSRLMRRCSNVWDSIRWNRQYIQRCYAEWLSPFHSLPSLNISTKSFPLPFSFDTTIPDSHDYSHRYWATFLNNKYLVMHIKLTKHIIRQTTKRYATVCNIYLFIIRKKYCESKWKSGEIRSSHTHTLTFRCRLYFNY